MKKSRKTIVAGRLREMMINGSVIIDKDCNVYQGGVLRKRRLSRYILKKIGAHLNPQTLMYEVKGGSHEKAAVSHNAQRGR